jgi:hypothetical protein
MASEASGEGDLDLTELEQLTGVSNTSGVTPATGNTLSLTRISPVLNGSGVTAPTDALDGLDISDILSEAADTPAAEDGPVDREEFLDISALESEILSKSAEDLTAGDNEDADLDDMLQADVPGPNVGRSAAELTGQPQPEAAGPPPAEEEEEEEEESTEPGVSQGKEEPEGNNKVAEEKAEMLIAVIGGSNSASAGTSLRTVEAFSVRSGAWRPLPALETARRDAGT